MRAVLAAICAYKMTHDGMSPTRREIMTRTGLRSISTVSYYLDRLQIAGLIQVAEAGEARGITVIGGRWLPPESMGVDLALAAIEKEMALKGYEETGGQSKHVILVRPSTGMRYPQIGVVARTVRDDGAR